MNCVCDCRMVDRCLVGLLSLELVLCFIAGLMSARNLAVLKGRAWYLMLEGHPAVEGARACCLRCLLMLHDVCRRAALPHLDQ